MDISNFMTWFVSQCVRIFSFTYQTLDNIQFAGTSILKVILYILLLGTILPIILTLPSAMVSAYSVKENKARSKSKSKGESNDNDSKW